MPVINCPCGHRMEGADDEELFRAIRAHQDQAHATMGITDERIREALAIRSRMSPWEGQRTILEAPLEIRVLGPEHLDDFLRFLDRDAFMDNPYWASCYCMEPHLTPEQFAQRSAAQRREEKRALIARGQAQGLLAYVGGRVVGWCHAAPRSTLAGLDSQEELRIDDAERVGSIVCFVIPAPYRHQGIATRLLDAACERLRAQGLAVAEAYPLKDPPSDARAFRGPLAMYLAAGFSPYREGQRQMMVRKPLG